MSMRIHHGPVSNTPFLSRNQTAVPKIPVNALPRGVEKKLLLFCCLYIVLYRCVEYLK